MSMQHDDPAAPPAKPLPWWRRLEQTKLTPLVFVAFFVALALMSGAAALVGYVTHALSHGHHP